LLVGKNPEPSFWEYPNPFLEPRKTFAKSRFTFGKTPSRRRGGGERDKPLSIFAGKGVSKVEFTSFQQRIQHQLDAYCKKVLRYAARDIYKRLARQAEREISMSDFSESGASIAAIMDDYFEEERQFEALGFSVAIKSELLSEALRLLPERQREIIMRYYFLGMSDREIGESSDTRRSTVSYQRNAAIKKLYEIMEGLRYEE
jgi:RNA polymerase sigma factor (sigma-70 family)